ncbi:MAG: prepilin-type N-terminal cleavage/methylation domain-containing protein [Hydrogenothermaceae bacterium]|nr:prepilin-type N-terminal cleavage/methylation domain-containing protein [Hydrogenothermaceae bacterium]
MMKQHERGFTLLELAIVLVIIGIILGAILKGQELINNAKAKRLLNDIKGLATLHYTFYDRYGRFPGDCDGDGDVDYITLNAVPGSFTATSGAFCYTPASPTANTTANPQWQELLQAQLVSFSNARDVAKHSFSGALYAAGPAVGAGAGAVNYNVIVARQVPCFAAKVVDMAIDGSLDAGTGSVREIAPVNRLTTVGADAWTACTTEQTLVDIIYLFDRRPN